MKVVGIIERDGALTNDSGLDVAAVNASERIDDELTETSNWCPAVTAFTAMTAQTPNDDGESTADR